MFFLIKYCKSLEEGRFGMGDHVYTTNCAPVGLKLRTAESLHVFPRCTHKAFRTPQELILMGLTHMNSILYLLVWFLKSRYPASIWVCILTSVCPHGSPCHLTCAFTLQSWQSAQRFRATHSHTHNLPSPPLEGGSPLRASLLFSSSGSSAPLLHVLFVAPLPHLLPLSRFTEAKLLY